MATFDTTRTSYGTPSLAGRLSNVFSRVVGAIIDWNDARVTRNALASLTDRELDDIGLTRGDIDLVAERKITR